MYQNGSLATGWAVHATSRNPLNNLADIPSEQRLKFDLEQPSTWLNLPAGADLIWCFPATPLEQVRAFARTLDAPPRRIVVLGSTSAYEVSDHSAEYPPSWIDESAPIDLIQVACAGRGISARTSWRHRPPCGRNLRTRAEPAGLDQARPRRPITQVCESHSRGRPGGHLPGSDREREARRGLQRQRWHALSLE